MYNTIPESTDSTIIFRYQNSLQCFDSRSYSPALTDGRMSIYEVQSALQDIQEIQQRFTRQFQRSAWFFLLLEIICIAAFVIVIIDSTVDSNIVIPALIIYLVILFASTIIYFIYILRLRERCLKTTQVTLDGYNQSLTSRGLRWIVPNQFLKWIELKKEYYVQDQNIPSIDKNQYSYEMALNTPVKHEQHQHYAQNYYSPYTRNNGYYANVSQQGYDAFGGGYNPQQTYIPPQQPEY